jgi:hypothetical protein
MYFVSSGSFEAGFGSGSTTIHLCEPVPRTAVDLDESGTYALVASGPFEVIAQSQLLPYGKLTAAEVVNGIRKEAPHADVHVASTEDGGLAIEFEADSGRELFAVLPDDGSRCFFVARERSAGFRQAGVLTSNQNAAPALGRWLRGALAELPSYGVEFVP